MKKITNAEIKAIALMMGRAFADYPLIKYLFPDPKTYEKKTLQYFTGILQYGRRYGNIFTTSTEIEGALVVLPHDVSDFPLMKIIRSGLLGKFLALGPSILKRLFHDNAIQTEIHSKHTKKVPHLYITTLAVDPKHQGKKFGKQLLNQAMEWKKDQFKFYYLETYLAKNVQIYKKLGFRLVEEKEVPETNLKLRALIKDVSA